MKLFSFKFSVSFILLKKSPLSVQTRPNKHKWSSMCNAAWRQDEAKPRISKQLSEAKNHYLYLITGELHLETLNVTGPVHIIHHLFCLLLLIDTSTLVQ